MAAAARATVREEPDVESILDSVNILHCLHCVILAEDRGRNRNVVRERPSGEANIQGAVFGVYPYMTTSRALEVVGR